MIKLRDYQEEIFDRVVSYSTRNLSTIVSLTSGAGKSYIIAKLAEFYSSQGLDVVVLVPFVAVRKQISDLFKDNGIEVTVSSSLKILNNKQDYPNIDVFLIDEAHHSAADSYTKLFDLFPKSLKVGFSATPVRNDNKALFGIYDYIITSDMTPTKLIELGYLSKFIYYAPSNSDIANHAISRDKLVVGDSSYIIGSKNKSNKRVVYGDVFKTWSKYAKNYQTVLFAPNVESAEGYAEIFKANGVSAEVISSKLHPKTVLSIIERYRNGEITVLCNYNMISEGFDMKEVDCVILTATTFSYPLFYQRAYRALRKNGKRKAIVLDHGDNASIHGMIDIVKEYSLTPTEESEDKDDRQLLFDRTGSDWAFEEARGVELREVYRYEKGYDSKYDKLVARADELHNFEGFLLLVQVQNELGIVSGYGQTSWSYAYAKAKGYKDIPDIGGSRWLG